MVSKSIIQQCCASMGAPLVLRPLLRRVCVNRLGARGLITVELLLARGPWILTLHGSLTLLALNSRSRINHDCGFPLR